MYHLVRVNPAKVKKAAAVSDSRFILGGGMLS
jgi:hypothetical protein